MNPNAPQENGFHNLAPLQEQGNGALPPVVSMRVSNAAYQGIPPWAAAMGFGAIWGGVGYFGVGKALALIADNPIGSEKYKGIWKSFGGALGGIGLGLIGARSGYAYAAEGVKQVDALNRQVQQAQAANVLPQYQVEAKTAEPQQAIQSVHGEIIRR